MPFQTFNLITGARARIRCLLLDRFLACMKPASITERQLRAGVFFFRVAGLNDPDGCGIIGAITAPTSRQFATVEQIGGTVVDLCCPHAVQVIGTTISLDGGWTAP